MCVRQENIACLVVIILHTLDVYQYTTIFRTVEGPSLQEPIPQAGGAFLRVTEHSYEYSAGCYSTLATSNFHPSKYTYCNYWCIMNI